MMERIEKPRIGVARKLARTLIKKSGVAKVPVSLRVIISYLKRGRDMDIYLTDGFSDQLSGLLVTVESEYLDERRDEIHVNKNHPWVKRRFSIAHEIGHMLMNTTCSNFEASLNDNRCAEIEANQFAAELLVPLLMLKDDLKKVGNVETLAWNYIVSKETMGWKISGSGLLNKI